MDKKDTIVDYYKVLQCDRTASSDELKKSYQRLVLSLHPDKSDENARKEGFLLVQKAWSVLRDPQNRKQYDAMLTCNEHSELLLYDTISLSDMTFDTCEGVYTYGCRCGGTYLLEPNVSISSDIVIGCDECSFSIQVNKC